MPGGGTGAIDQDEESSKRGASQQGLDDIPLPWPRVGADLRALGSMLKSPIATSPQAIPTKPIELGLSPTATPNSTGRPAVCIAVTGATTLICPRAKASYSNA